MLETGSPIDAEVEASRRALQQTAQGMRENLRAALSLRGWTKERPGAVLGCTSALSFAAGLSLSLLRGRSKVRKLDTSMDADPRNAAPPKCEAATQPPPRERRRSVFASLAHVLGSMLWVAGKKTAQGLVSPLRAPSLAEEAARKDAAQTNGSRAA